MEDGDKLEVPDQTGTIAPDTESENSLNQTYDIYDYRLQSTNEMEALLNQVSSDNIVAHQDSFVVVSKSAQTAVSMQANNDNNEFNSTKLPIFSMNETELKSPPSLSDIHENNDDTGDIPTRNFIQDGSSQPNNVIASDPLIPEFAFETFQVQSRETYTPLEVQSDPPALDRVPDFPPVKEVDPIISQLHLSSSSLSSKGKLAYLSNQHLSGSVGQLEIPVSSSSNGVAALDPTVSMLSSFQELGGSSAHIIHDSMGNGDVPRYLIQRNHRNNDRKLENGYLTSSVMGRRRIILRLEEDVFDKQPPKKKSARFESGLLGHIRKRSTDIVFGGGRRGNSMSAINILDTLNEDNLGANAFYSQVPRGKLVVSWFEGTSSLDLHEHVRKCVVRKLSRSQGFSPDIEIHDLRLIDETFDPPEEIVLSPFVPDGMNFVCRFSINNKYGRDGSSTPVSEYSYSIIRPPVSPGAAPSPSNESDIFAGLNLQQLALINKKLNSSMIDTNPRSTTKQRSVRNVAKQNSLKELQVKSMNEMMRPSLEESEKNVFEARTEVEPTGSIENDPKQKDDNDENDSKAMTEDEDDDTMLHSEDPIESRFREIFHLILHERRKSNALLREKVKDEKRQVIFFVANYLVLFLAVIAISAEIQARAPAWLRMVENELLKAHHCGATQEALFECVSRGDFAGLLASIGIFFSRSLATRRIFLFGFETPKKLWTVVYECLVSAICWSFSHLFIRRGLNPDTRERFIQKHWKDTVYGGLAGFFAAFLKMVLKNLIPQEVVEDALRDRRLKILSWLPGLISYE